ncbi:DUF3168 domain-containing protein [Paracoccus laeviglucosivorans]|uniref:Uncharacterized protein n=1 Tax=Paracoccus laeviglucosivorans TaxID=1197861 RepID=A0A521E6U1_9RHOB|nr:DUF3168 domain-containing protein [Paracoccus laeviglucosivorans]SMO78890.1 Protein of unknown function [Paracoccus laeviglucosivorans]
MKAGRILRRIIQNRIIAQVPELNAQVYDKTSKDDPYPNATMGPSYWSPDDADCIEGKLWTGQIDLWDNASNKGALEDLADDVAAALRGFADTADVAMHPFEVTLVRVMDDPDGVSVHGVVQVETRVETDGAESP